MVLAAWNIKKEQWPGYHCVRKWGPESALVVTRATQELELLWLLLSLAKTGAVFCFYATYCIIFIYINNYGFISILPK